MRSKGEHMKEEIIKKIYNGELYPAENILPKDKTYWKLIKEEGKGSY